MSGFARGVWRELVGLLVDDERLALSLLGWTGLCGLALWFAPQLGHAAGGTVLAAGYAMLLLANVLIRATRR